MSPVPTSSHPSVFIIEEMEARNWTRDDLATAMTGGTDLREWGIARLSLDFYFDIGPNERNLRMGDDAAFQFGRAFGVDPQFFLNLETSWLEGGAS